MNTATTSDYILYKKERKMKTFMNFLGMLLALAVIVVVGYLAYEMFFACDFTFGGACLRF